MLNMLHDTDRVVLFDLETHSNLDLTEVGGRRYAEHSSTIILSLVALVGDTFHVWIPKSLDVDVEKLYSIWPNEYPQERYEVHNTSELPDAIATKCGTHTFVAHNCMDFDALVWRSKISPVPTSWFDTLPCARAAGYSGKLDTLGELFLGRGKIETGKLFKQLYSKQGKIFPGKYELLLRYNIGDVILLREVYHRVAQYGEADLIPLHYRINERGIKVDRALLSKIQTLSIGAQERAGREIEHITSGVVTPKVLRSHKQLSEWLRSKGVKLPNLQRETIDALLDNPDEYGSEIDPLALRVLDLRQVFTRVTGGKVERALSFISDDDRLRDMIIYHGANTGRFSSRAVQVHNLPRGVADVNYDVLIDGASDLSTFDAESNRLGCSVDDLLSTLIRPCFVASQGSTLLVADFAGIEARGIAWIADDVPALDVFRNDHDPYLRIASKIFGRELSKADKLERQIGKVCELGCGYGMGAIKFDLYATKSGADLVKAGVTAKKCITDYRNAHPAICDRQDGVWSRLERAAFDAVGRKTSSIAGKCQFLPRDDALVIVLPSGRELLYRRARIEDREPMYVKLYGLRSFTVPTLLYDSPRGTKTLYGGLLAENIVQAICRDLLCIAMIQLDRLGYDIVLHVHDEIVLEGSESQLGDFVRIMSIVPEWAKGFPIKVEAHAHQRYLKTPPQGSKKCVAKDGVLLC